MRISLMTAEPPPVSLKLTWSSRPSEPFPSQEPGKVLMAVNAFCASVWAEAVAATARAARIMQEMRSDLELDMTFSPFSTIEFIFVGAIAIHVRARLPQKLSDW